MSNSGLHVYLAVKLAQYREDERQRLAAEGRLARRVRRSRRAR